MKTLQLFILPVLCGSLLLGGTSYASKLGQATRRQVRDVAHALFSFEHVKVRRGEIHRRQLTRGYYGQHELRYKSGKHVRANQMLTSLFGPGQMRVREDKGRKTVLWQSEAGQLRTLGALVRVGSQSYFKPTVATRRHRNRTLGQLLKTGIASQVTGVRSGYWASWLDREVVTRGDNHTRVRYQAGSTPPHGRSVHYSSRGLLEQAAGAKVRALSQLGDALKPVGASAGGTTKGGLSVSWTDKAAGRAPNTRHRLIFRPDGWRAGGRVQRLFGMLTGGDHGQQGGANYEVETFQPGAKRQRQITRREKRRIVGWIKDQQKRWKHLSASSFNAVAREKAVVRGLLQLGNRDLWNKKPAPAPSNDYPPNVMLASLYGEGKLVFGNKTSAGREVYWAPHAGSRRRLGILYGRTFTAADQVVQARNQYVGETVLTAVVSAERVKKGYGYDAHTQLLRFPQQTLAKSPRTMKVGGYDVPVSKEVRITEQRGHILDSIGQLWPRPIQRLVDGGVRKQGIEVRWTSDTIVKPKGNERGGTLVKVPEGFKVHHKVRFHRPERYGTHQITHSYAIVEAAGAGG